MLQLLPPVEAVDGLKLKANFLSVDENLGLIPSLPVVRAVI